MQTAASQLSYVAGRRYFTLVFAVFAHTGLALIWLDDDATCITYSSSSSWGVPGNVYRYPAI